VTERALGELTEAHESKERIDLTRVLSYLVMAAIAVSVLLPLIPIFVWAFSERWFFPELLPPKLTLKAWEYLSEPGSKTLKAATTGGLIALIATVISLVLGLPAGRAMGLHQFKGKRLVQFFILAPVIVPGLAAVMGIHVMFIRLGLSGTVAGVTLSHLIGTTPYVVMVMSSVFANYNPEYEEQARTLGAGPLRTFVHVTLPAIFPGVLVASFFAFIISWGRYIITLLVSGGKIITVPLLLVTFAHARNHTYTAALCLVFLAPSLVFLFVTSRYLTGEGGTLGGFGA
jgi:putative spermidine/putrescine transport system permease protein